ncbi:MAG: hypothetical protein ACPGYV_14055, partial [Phycisphaeraceae bacterium]
SKGDCHYLPSGTLHALGAGVLVAEVQTPSDTTYRIYDWARTDRELHIEQAMACIEFNDDIADEAEDEALPTIPWAEGLTMSVAAACEYFSILAFACDHDTVFNSDHEQDLPLGKHPAIYMPLAGSATITFTSGEAIELTPGRTTLVPASQIFIRSIRASAGARWLLVHPASPDR